MPEIADLLFNRHVVIALAIVGAAVATVGSLIGRRQGGAQRYAALMIRAGYGLTATSVLVFIVTGFLSR